MRSSLSRLSSGLPVMLPLFWMSLLAVLAGGAARAQPARLHDVKAWRGSFTATVSANDSRSGRGWEEINPWSATSQYNGTISVQFLLDDFEDEPAVWRGRVVSSSLTATYRGVAVGEGKRGAVVEGEFSTSGALEPEPGREVKLVFHRDRGWSVHVGNVRRPARYKEVTTFKESGKVFRDERDVRAYALSSTPTLPYPAKGLILSGKGRLTGETGGQVDVSSNVSLPLEWDYEVSLEPASLQELKLEIVEPAAYADWRPETTPDGTAGGPLEVTARVVTVDGAAPRTTVESFEWQLVETSREPGVALNFPVDSRNQRFDLELDATGEFFVLSQENQKMERAVREGFSDTVKVVPFDWGGWSTLQVAAVLADGRRLTGKLTGKTEEGLRVPKRAFDSHIADGWKKKAGASGADRGDDDNAPEGDGTKGDGLTLYEEYRGFYEDGEHIEGDPKTKDFFLRLKQAGAALPGIAKFQGVTKLKVHHRFTSLEFPESRIINANYDRGAHLVSQHGVVVRINPNLKGKADTVGGPGNPKMITRVDLMADFAQFDPARAAKIVAHELGHCINVWHHGDTDEKVIWATEGGKLYEVSSKAPKGEEITVVTEKLVDLTAGYIAQLEKLPDNALVGYRGNDNGQHSGSETCIMRYHNAQTYAFRDGPGLRFSAYVEPVAADCLCASSTGTGVNQPGHQPQSRYGPTLPLRGNCLRQIHVTDAVAAPSRDSSAPKS